MVGTTLPAAAYAAAAPLRATLPARILGALPSGSVPDVSLLAQHGPTYP